MKFLLDTCFISEFARPDPHPAILAWLAQQDELTLHLAAISVGELKRGVERLAEGKRKHFLQTWLLESVVKRFGERVLPLDLDVLLRWGEMQAEVERLGRPLPVIDGLIAATALRYRLTVVTRNVRDMEASGVALFNPWQS